MSKVKPRDRVTLSRPIESIGPGAASRPVSTGRFSSAAQQLTAAIAADGPLWVELELHADPKTWMDPWHDDVTEVDWHELEETAHTFRFGLPPDEPGDARSLEEIVLTRLPHINELGQLRWLYAELDEMGANQVIALPLVGFSPIGDYGCDSQPGALEFILLRVNMAVIGPYLFTIRLPDRLCSGVRLLEEGPRDHRPRRFAASAHCAELPKLDHFKRYLPYGRSTATDLGTALALYLSATCDCVAEHARGRLVEVEMSLDAAEPESPETGSADALEEREKDLRRLDVVNAKQREILEARGTLQVADEELGRLLQRQFELEGRDVEFLRATRSRYQHALDAVRAVERDLRAAGDALSTRASTLQAASLTRQELESKERARRGELRNRAIAILGTVLVVATLVASLSRDGSKLPHPDSTRVFLGMVGAMLGLSALLLFGLFSYVLQNDPEGKRWILPAWLGVGAAAVLSALGIVEWVR